MAKPFDPQAPQPQRVQAPQGVQPQNMQTMVNRNPQAPTMQTMVNRNPQAPVTPTLLGRSPQGAPPQNMQTLLNTQAAMNRQGNVTTQPKPMLSTANAPQGTALLNQIKPLSAPAPNPAAPNPAAPNPAAPNPAAQNNNLNTAINNLMAQQQLGRDAYATQQQGNVSQLNNLLSTDNYNAILDKVLQQNMAAFAPTEAAINKGYEQSARAIDIDAERRGVYNSGTAADLQRQNEDARVATIADQLAQIRRESTANAQNYVTQQLQGLGMQGDWLNTGRQLDQGDASLAVNAQLGMDKADLERTLGQGQLGIDQQRVSNDLLLGQGQLGIDQQNANTNLTRVSNDLLLGQGQLGIDQQNADTNLTRANNDFFLGQAANDNDSVRIANDLLLGQGQLGIDQQNADTNRTRATNDFTLGKESNAIDRTRVSNDFKLGNAANQNDRLSINNDYKLGQGQLGVSRQNANTAAAANVLDRDKYNSEQTLINNQMKADNMAVAQGGQDLYNTLIGNTNMSSEERHAALELYKPYPQVYNNLKNQLNQWEAAQKSPNGARITSSGERVAAPTSSRGDLQKPRVTPGPASKPKPTPTPTPRPR